MRLKKGGDPEHGNGAELMTGNETHKKGGDPEHGNGAEPEQGCYPASPLRQPPPHSGNRPAHSGSAASTVEAQPLGEWLHQRRELSCNQVQDFVLLWVQAIKSPGLHAAQWGRIPTVLILKCRIYYLGKNLSY